MSNAAADSSSGVEWCHSLFSVHPSLPLLATCSGQRKFLLSRRDRDSESEEEEECETFENSFKIWSLLGTQTGLYSEILAQSLSSM